MYFSNLHGQERLSRWAQKLRHLFLLMLQLRRHCEITLKLLWRARHARQARGVQDHARRSVRRRRGVLHLPLHKRFRGGLTDDAAVYDAGDPVILASNAATVAKHCLGRKPTRDVTDYANYALGL